MPTTVVVGGKLLGFLAAMAVMLVVVLLATVGVQTLKGYHHYEFPLYAQVLLGIVWPSTVQLTLLALLVHTLVNNKYVGHVVMIVFYVLTLVLNSWGFERVLYQYGLPTDYVYSDMNRFGHYAPFLTLLVVYDSAIALVLLVVAYLFWVRGSDDSWSARLREAGMRWRARSTRVVGGLTALGAVAAGGFVFYNTAVLNRFTSTKDIERRRAAYERDYRRFKDLAQPRIVGVRIRADLVPERRAFALRSVYRLVNRHPRALDTLYVSLGAVGFGGDIHGGRWSLAGYRLSSCGAVSDRVLVADSGRGVYLYRLATPLAPGTPYVRGPTTTDGFPFHIPTTTSWPTGRSSTTAISRRWAT